MHLAQTGQQGLGGLGILADGDGGIFFSQTCQTLEDLVFVAGLLGVNCHGDGGLGEVQSVELDGLCGVAQGVRGTHGSQLGQSGDIAGDDLFNCDLLLAALDVDGAGLFGLLNIGVVQSGGVVQHAGGDLHQAQLANEGVGQGLEDLSGEGLILGADTLVGFAGLGVDALGDGAFGRGHDVLDGVKQGGDTDAGQSGAAYDGHERTVGNTLAQTGDGLFGGQFHFFEELLHELFVAACGGFHQNFACCLNVVSNGSGDIGDLVVLAFAHVGLVVKQAGYANELAAFDNGNLNGSDSSAVLLGDGGQSLFEVGVFTVHLVDDDQAGGTGLAGQIPCLLGADGQAADCANGDQCVFADGHGADHLAGEVEVAGNVDEVILGFIPLEGSHARGNGYFTLYLFGIAVGSSGTVFNAALTVDSAGIIEQSFDEGGFTVTAMADHGDVADVAGRVVLHCYSS